MKPYITDACKDGRCTLRIQLEGVQCEQLKESLLVTTLLVARYPLRIH
jgi:hypothetical protein